MKSAHEEMTALAPAYALGALDPEERRLFEAHLAACPWCAAEVHSFTPVSSSLAENLPAARPSARVRDQIVGAVRAPDGAEVSGRPSAGGQGRTALAAWLPLAASVVMAAAIGLYAAGLRGRVVDLEARLDRATAQMLVADATLAAARRVAFESQSAMAVLAAPDLARIDLAGADVAPRASARALWSRQRGMVFAAINLPPLPEGRVYQVWVVTGDAPISAGLLELDSSGRGTGIFATPPDIAQPLAVAVTLEPEGGVPAPTGRRYLIGTPTPQI